MGGTCNLYGGEEKCEQGFGWETWRNEITWMTKVWVGGYYLKMDLKEIGWEGVG